MDRSANDRADDVLNREMRRNRERRKEDKIISQAAFIIHQRNQSNPCKETLNVIDVWGKRRSDAQITIEVFFHEPEGK